MEAEETARIRVKNKLKEYYDMAVERRLLEKELKELESQICSLGSPEMDGMPKGGSVSDPTAKTAVGSVALQELYRERLQQIQLEQTDAERMIGDLYARERVLMRMRYIKGRSWTEICELMNYSWTHVHRIHGTVLKKLIAQEMQKMV